jgi:hypothetical protein
MQVIFYNYVVSCNCGYCKRIRSIMNTQDLLHIHSYDIKEE